MFNYTNKVIQNWKKQVSPRLSPLLSFVWVGGFAIAILSLWLFFQITERVFAEQTTEIDTEILQSIYKLHTPLLNQIMTGITFLGNGSTLIYFSCIVVICLLVSRKFASAFALIIVTFGGLNLNVWLKTIFGRVRPTLWERIVDANSFSFPSGHAMVSLVVYGFVGYLLIANFPNFKGLILFCITLLILAIGLSRLYLGVHWPTDIIAGYAAGLVWLISCIFSLEILQSLLRKENQETVIQE